MNKRGQAMGMPGQSDNYKNVSPLVFLGIAVFVLPFFKTIVKINFPGWLTGVGIVLIIIGAIHSAFMRG